MDPGGSDGKMRKRDSVKLQQTNKPPEAIHHRVKLRTPTGTRVR